MCGEQEHFPKGAVRYVIIILLFRTTFAAVIVTNFHKAIGMEDEAYAAYLKHCETTHPLGRVGTGEEVAASIAFLACDATASFTTGTCLRVDGGKHILTPR